LPLRFRATGKRKSMRLITRKSLSLARASHHIITTLTLSTETSRAPVKILDQIGEA
jgi:hypothetical protein